MKDYWNVPSTKTTKAHQGLRQRLNNLKHKLILLRQPQGFQKFSFRIAYEHTNIRQGFYLVIILFRNSHISIYAKKSALPTHNKTSTCDSPEPEFRKYFPSLIEIQ